MSGLDMKEFADHAKKYAIHNKTTYYTQSVLEFGMIRVYETYAELDSVKIQMRVFKDKDETVNWLKEGLA